MSANNLRRLKGHLARARHLGWPVPRSLRADLKTALTRRGWRIRGNPSPDLLHLAALVAEIPTAALDAAEELNTETAGHGEIN